MEIDETIVGDIYYQTYDAQEEIEGVSIYPLKKHRSLEGAFMELMRINEGFAQHADLAIRQLSISWAVPGRLNAFHVHPKIIQNELWCVIQGSLMIWLVDIREDSPTWGVKARYFLSGEDPQLLYIPFGVAHGYKAGADGAILVYAMDSQFDPDNPNEGRLPWDFFGADIWEEDRG